MVYLQCQVLTILYSLDTDNRTRFSCHSATGAKHNGKSSQSYCLIYRLSGACAFNKYIQVRVDWAYTCWECNAIIIA